MTVARVLKTQGRRGEVAVEVHSDVPDRFKVGLKLGALGKDDSKRELEIEELWPHKAHLILKFVGVDSIADAEALAGCELQIPREQRAKLEPGWTYIGDLVGCTVAAAGREIGKIRDVRSGAGEAPLLVVQSGSKEHEIPYAQAYLESVDLEKRQVRMLLPDGMLELDAPLSAEEKEQQGSSQESGVRSQKKRADY
ncbi:MAG TPA: ribosome maturation factor RimM [Terriglobales bacterium]|nr:ribosome maturation factor RimM [Terriglobales bacterium]